jgi:hypothetical protein
MNKLKFAGAAVAMLGIGVLVAAAPSLAQQPAPPTASPPGPPPGAPPGPPGPDGPMGRWMRGGGHGMMTDGGMMGRDGMGMMGRGEMCGELVSRLAQRRMERIEQVVKPTDAQRQAFADLKTAATKAADIVRAACPTEQFLTPTGRLESAEKRTEARLQAIRTVRPALENFYKSLSDEQKAHFNAIRPHHVPKWAGGDWRARWHHAWQNFRDHNRGAWRDNGSNDRSGGWRGRRGGDRTGLEGQGGNNGQATVEGRGVDRQGKLDQRDADHQGSTDGRGAENDGMNPSANQGEEEHM